MSDPKIPKTAKEAILIAQAIRLSNVPGEAAREWFQSLPEEHRWAIVRWHSPSPEMVNSFQESFQESLDLRQQIKALGPWHYNHVIQGVSTGEVGVLVEETHPKLQELLRCGAFRQSKYLRVLDLGANSGLLSMWFADNRGTYEAWALEKETSYYMQLCFAVEHKGYSGRVIPIQYDLQQPLPPFDVFDLVLCLGLLHHLSTERWIPLLQECRALLREGGEIVVQTATHVHVPYLLERAGFSNAVSYHCNWPDRWAFGSTK